MIFDKRQARAIADGRVTRIYLPVRRGMAGAPVASIVLRPGCDVPVTSRGGHAPLCTVRVLQRLRTPLRALTLRDVRAAGWRTSGDFREAWVRRYDKPWIERHRVGLCSTEEVVNRVLRERFADYWADRLAWAITVAVVTDRPRFMASQRGRALGDGQYTPIAADAIDRAEVVPERWLDREAARRAEHSEAMRAALRADAGAERQCRRNARIATLRARV